MSAIFAHSFRDLTGEEDDDVAMCVNYIDDQSFMPYEYDSDDADEDGGFHCDEVRAVGPGPLYLSKAIISDGQITTSWTSFCEKADESKGMDAWCNQRVPMQFFKVDFAEHNILVIKNVYDLLKHLSTDGTSMYEEIMQERIDTISDIYEFVDGLNKKMKDYFYGLKLKDEDVSKIQQPHQVVEYIQLTKPSRKESKPYLYRLFYNLVHLHQLVLEGPGRYSIALKMLEIQEKYNGMYLAQSLFDTTSRLCQEDDRDYIEYFDADQLLLWQWPKGLKHSSNYDDLV